MDYARRQQCIERHLGSASPVDALLITHPPNLRYLTGFTGSSAALLLFESGSRKPAFFTDGRYREQARQEVKGARVVVGKRAAWQEAAAYGSRLGLKTLGVEAEHVSLALRANLRRLLKGVRLREIPAIIERARMVKDADELRKIQAAADLGTSLLKVALKAIRPGVREVEVAAEMEYAARRAGASAMSFETIVAAGRRSALPHGQASTAAIPAKGFIVLDFGVILAGYCSDMTRTVHMGRCADRDRRRYAAVQQAQQAAVSALREGVTAGAVDEVARRVLRKARLDGYFTHSTGHGVGLEIHEPPRLGRGQTERLQAGMVVTVEPGIYIAGQGGVRIEDMVVVTRTGHRVLTAAPRDLIEL